MSFWNTLVRSGLPLAGRVLQLLREHIPMPASVAQQGVTEAQYYAALPRYATQPQPVIDAAAAAAELRQQVLDPLAGMQPLFTGHRYLTRLATYISPEEMTKDPLFVTNRTLPDVSNQHTAVARLLCGDEDHDVCHAPVSLQVEGGSSVRFRSLAPAGICDSSQRPPYDRAQLDGMPAADRGWRRDPAGEGDLVLDNGGAIRAAVAMHNAAGDSGGGCAVVARTARRPWAALALGAGVWLVLRRTRRRRQRR